MYARSNTFMGTPQAMDDAIAYARDEVMPMVQGMDGCVGLSMLCDRDSGRSIVTTAWTSEEAMHASDQGVRDSRSRGAEVFGSGAPEVREWEIALVHRMHEGHDGACARVLWGEMDPAAIDDAISTARTSLVSRLEELPGFCSISMMVDRGSGRCVSTVCYDSRADMERAGDRAAALREQMSGAMAVRLTDMAQFELVLHHLRVPEMA